MIWYQLRWQISRKGRGDSAATNVLTVTVHGNGRPTFGTVGRNSPFELEEIRMAYQARRRKRFTETFELLNEEG